MKRKLILPVLIVSGLIAGCGPSAEEQAADAKRMADSVASAEAAKKAAEEAALAQDAIQDSLARANDTTAVAADASAQ
jgi:hypothetical protein